MHALLDRGYHEAVADFVPPEDAVWRQDRPTDGPDLVIAHNDAAPYNAAWRDGRLVGFVDWDMAGPRPRDDDLAWTAFSWVPLHARLEAEGFTDLGRREERLRLFLDAYGSTTSSAEIRQRLRTLLRQQIELMHAKAAAGDATYARMLAAGRDRDLAVAAAELAGQPR